VNPRDGHLEPELHLTRFDSAADRRGGLRHGGRRQWKMSFAGQQARRRIEADPPGAGNEDFRPGVQVGEIRGRPRRSLQWFLVRRQLDQVARDKPRRQSEVPQELHQ
jgi:hypothetical protein